MVLFIIGLVLTLGLIGFCVYYDIRFVKEKPLGQDEIKIDKNRFIILMVTNLSVGLPLIMTSYGVALWQGWNLSLLEHLFMIVGSYLFGSALMVFFSTFTLYYYKPELIKKQRLILRILMFSMIPTIVIGLWIMTEGYAEHLDYPLWNSFSFSPFGFATFQTNSKFRITFYGVVIVVGALISYFICDHYFYKKYGKHGLLEVPFMVAFPAGIVGGRLWYCLVLRPEYYLSNPLQIIVGIVDGGMAIQGGAIGGILAGVAFMCIFRRYVNLRWAADTIIPTILIAQFVGRWGNFFNCEVHGYAVEMSNFWFLPNIIKYQMQYSSVSGYGPLVGTGQMYLPLFLIEGLINLAGYFIIRYATKPLNRFIPVMCRAGLYPIWYGLVRVFLEPLRTGWNSTQGGDAFTQSFITAFVMIGIGVAVIIWAVVWALVEKKVKKLDHFQTYEY